MKRISILVVATLLATASFAQVKKSPAPERYGWDQEYPLYGDVKAVTITEYSVSDYFGEIVNNSIENLSAYVFDDKGNVVRYGLAESGNIEYKYDSEGRLIEKIRYNGEELLEKHMLKYNIQGDTLEHTEYDNGGNMLSKTRYEYNTSGFLIAKALYGRKGLLVEKELYTYDSNNKLLKYSLYGDGGEFIKNIAYSYDNKGRLVEKCERVSCQDCKVENQKYVYDSRNNIVEEAIYVNGNLICIHKYKYNSHRQQVRKTTHKAIVSPNNLKEAISNSLEENIVSDISYEYNDNGQLIKQIMKSFDYVEIIEWMYDSSGNCNKKTVSYVLKNMHTGTDTEYYDYELNGNLLKVEKYRNNELYETVECKYDTRGNLIEKILYLGGVKIPIKRTEYNIVYSDDEMVFEQHDYCLEDLDKDSLVGNNDNEDYEFVKVERMPSFAGGDLNTFRQWFGSEFKYPAIAAENGIQGRLIVKFVVEKDGRLTNIEFLQSPDPVFNEEVLRVLRKSPKWTPGYQQGKPCRVSYMLPIDIRLQ